MAKLKIRIFPDPDLRVKADKVESVGQAEKDLLADMALTMYLSQGVGLAATQVGISKSLVVIDVGDGLIKLVNPIITKKEGAQVSEEGCLSVPGECIKIKRAKIVVVNFLNEDGEPSRIKGEGLFAKAVQHELDHLSGKLIIDYLNPIKKLLTRTKSCRRI
ncbi:MAG: peptide deformylase [Candidatus Omnitrophica bacterium]|nr:peptide deformylase [Candidatus Omnitrophota bacterium]